MFLCVSPLILSHLGNKVWLLGGSSGELGVTMGRRYFTFVQWVRFLELSNGEHMSPVQAWGRRRPPPLPYGLTPFSLVGTWLPQWHLSCVLCCLSASCLQSAPSECGDEGDPNDTRNALKDSVFLDSPNIPRPCFAGGKKDMLGEIQSPKGM